MKSGENTVASGRRRRARRTAASLTIVASIVAGLALVVFAAAAWRAPAATAATSLTNAEREVVRLINEERAERGLPALRVRTSLCRAADLHSRDMVVNDFFSHRSSNGQTVGPRLRRYGYSTSGCLSWRVGENIAWGTWAYRTPEMVVRLWMNSPPHRRAILDPAFWDIGVGRRSGTFCGRRNAVLTTVDFGRRIRWADDVAGAPRLEDMTVQQATLERTRAGRERCGVSFSTNEVAKTRVTMRREDGSWARTVRGWTWAPAGAHCAAWNGTVEAPVSAGSGTIRVKVPAPDGRYKVLVEAKDIQGNRSTQVAWVTCESDPGEWGDGATFVTRATRSFTIRRGNRAVFSFAAVYVPPDGGTVPSSRVTLTLKVRDSDGRSRYTRSWSDVPLNRLRSHAIRRCRLARGTYRYSIYATLPDGTTQQLVGSARMRIR